MAILAASLCQMAVATAGQKTILATGDTRLMSPGWYSGLDSELGVYQDRDRILIQFDLSSIPVGATITSATLGLYDNGYSHDGSQLQMFRVTKPWTEGTSSADGAVWTLTNGVDAWDNPGGDAVGTLGNQFAEPYSFTTSGGSIWNWDATALVTEWYAGTHPNYGLMIKQEGTASEKHFKSRETGQATAPFLTVQYTGGIPADMNLTLQDWTGTSQSNYPDQSSFLTNAGLEAALVWSGGGGAWERVTFDSAGATFGLGNAGYEGRNTIRTIEEDYDSVSFDAYVTVASLGTNFEAWLGLGSGAIVSWNGPSAPADHAVFMSLRSGEEPWDIGNINNRYSAIKVGPTAQTSDDHYGAYGAATEIRMKMSYDAVAKTATFSFDNNYDGVTFSPDQTLAPIDTSDLFSGKAAKVFFGSRSGGGLKDFKITKTTAAPSDFGSWALANGVTGGPTGDSDKDGVANLVEYALVDGGERGSFNAATGTVSFTKRAAPYGTDVTIAIEESDDLGVSDPWEAVEATTVGNTVSYTLPAGRSAVFTRLKVSENP